MLCKISLGRRIRILSLENLREYTCVYDKIPLPSVDYWVIDEDAIPLFCDIPEEILDRLDKEEIIKIIWNEFPELSL